MIVPRLVAHRGYMNAYPENSLIGVEMALEAGACMVEFDVQMTADRKFVVLHDADFNRTAGVDKSVFDVSFSELSEVSIHYPDWFGNLYTQVPVPLLEQMMELVSRYPDAMACVEIKDESLKHWGLEYVISELQIVLERYTKQTIIIGYNYEAIELVGQTGKYRTGWVLTDFDAVSQEKAEQLCPDYIICNYKKVSYELWPGDWSWILYDITEPELALLWAERGAELIETAEIGEMLNHQILGKESCKHAL